MSSTRTAPRTTNINKTSTALNTHHTNGSANSYETNDSTVNSEFDSNLQRSVLMKNIPQSEGIYRNPRFIHAVTIGLLGQPVVIQTNEAERYHGILETISANGDVILSVAHRIDNNNDIMSLSTSLIDFFDTIDSSVQTFELQKRIIQSSNIVEMIALDIDLSGNGKCILDENPKVTQLEDDRFNRMEHFYGTDEIDPETLEDLDLGDDGKAGYDPEDMFHTNREKFNTKTDFDESKYTNVPVRPVTGDELIEIEKKVSEIERGIRDEDVDEDDAGVKRPSEYNQTQTIDDGNSNTKTNQSSRIHSGGRSDFRCDADYNPTKRGNWREQRPSGGNNRRGGGGQNNYSTNNSKQNPRSDQTQYTSSRSSEQSTNNRQQQYKSRNNNRYTENLSPHEGRDSPLQITNDETTRGQRINSGSFSQGQNSGPTSPSTTIPGRTVYSRNSGQPIGRNSPAPYTGSSSSRNNSTTATSPPPSAPPSASYQTNTAGTGNYSQQSNNKMNKKQSRNEQQSTNDEIDQPKQQRNQQQNSSNNQSNTAPPIRPSQLHTQQIKQQQQQQQTSSSNNNNNNVPPPLTLPNQDDHSSAHESINPNQSDPTTHLTNAPMYTQHAAGTTTPGNAKGISGLNPEADEFVPVFTRESNSRPESRGASTSSITLNTFVPHAHPQALHLLQQQQQAQQSQAQQSSMIPSTHQQNTAALYQQYYQTQFANMPQFVNATPQQMSVGMMGTPMMLSQTQQQQLTGNGPNTNNPGSGGMTTPNGGSGPTYKPNNNPTHSGETSNSGVSNIAPKKAVVSVQRVEQSNVPQQQQQVTGAPQMIYPAAPIRYYQSEYMPQQGTPSSMQLQQIPFYYPINTSGLIPTGSTTVTGVGPPQNIMIPSSGSSTGQATSAQPSIYYQGVYPDPRMYGMYPTTASVNPGSVNANWQMTRSPPHQQQQQQQQQSEQQRAYGGGQNVVSQAPPPSGAPNTNGGGRSASTSGPSGQTGPGAGGPPMTQQYALNGNVSAAYAYGPPTAWYPAQSQVSSPQTNMPPQINAYSMMFDPSQQAPPQQPTYAHPSLYDAAYFQQAQQQQQQQQQQQSSQQGLDTVPSGNYNR